MGRRNGIGRKGIGKKIQKPAHFSLQDILESGQAFRFVPEGQGYLVSMKDLRAYVEEDTEDETLSFIFHREEDAPLFFSYFDLDHEYAKDFQTLREMNFPMEVLEFSSGIRMLRQDPEEVIVNFIISQNNNIKRIQKIVEALCRHAGEEKADGFGTYYAFPTMEALAQIPVEQYRRLGLGYRDKYLVGTSEFLLREPDFIPALSHLSTAEARKELLRLPGVGPKVADCILLFGLRRGDVFPLDTWMEKVFKERFSSQEKDRRKMANLASNTYGELAGFAQQLYFFHIRKR
ncbi:MAG: DNA glycosylase [Tissierellia bacterium]|nr:DNA glycosylase [Tissierellia bacterium]